MLYDPKWNRDIYSKESFVAWLGTQPPDEEYDFTKMFECATAQYLKVHGIAHHGLNSTELDTLGWIRIVHPRPALARPGNFTCGDYTFGAAYLRGMKELENAV
jgi:hypothetical protein